MNGMFVLLLVFAAGTPGSSVTQALTSQVIPMPDQATCEREATRTAQMKHLVISHCIDRRQASWLYGVK